MEESSRLGTHFTVVLLRLGSCMLLTNLTQLDSLGNAQKHETSLKHDHFISFVLVVQCLSFSFFLSDYLYSSFVSSCFLSSHSSASDIVTVGDEWEIMSNMADIRTRLMVWGTRR